MQIDAAIKLAESLCMNSDQVRQAVQNSYSAGFQTGTRAATAQMQQQNQTQMQNLRQTQAQALLLVATVAFVFGIALASLINFLKTKTLMLAAGKN